MSAKPKQACFLPWRFRAIWAPLRLARMICFHDPRVDVCCYACKPISTVWNRGVFWILQVFCEKKPLSRYQVPGGLFDPREAAGFTVDALCHNHQIRNHGIHTIHLALYNEFFLAVHKAKSRCHLCNIVEIEKVETWLIMIDTDVKSSELNRDEELTIRTQLRVDRIHQSNRPAMEKRICTVKKKNISHSSIRSGEL